MIRVTVEMLPHGRVKDRYLLCQASIALNLTATHEIGNYEVRLSRRGTASGAWRRGRVNGFPRKQLGVWDLLYWALRETVGNRSGRSRNRIVKVGDRAARPSKSTPSATNSDAIAGLESLE